MVLRMFALVSIANPSETWRAHSQTCRQHDVNLTCSSTNPLCTYALIRKGNAHIRKHSVKPPCTSPKLTCSIANIMQTQLVHSQTKRVLMQPTGSFVNLLQTCRKHSTYIPKHTGNPPCTFTKEIKKYWQHVGFGDDRVMFGDVCDVFALSLGHVLTVPMVLWINATGLRIGLKWRQFCDGFVEVCEC